MKVSRRAVRLEDSGSICVSAALFWRFQDTQRALTCTKKDVACCWVPCDDANTLGVALQYHDWL